MTGKKFTPSTPQKDIPALPAGFYAHPQSPLIAANIEGEIIGINKNSLRINSPATPEWKTKRPIKSNGYLMVGTPWFNAKGHAEMATVHRIVYECITGTLPDWSIKGKGLTIDHIDNDKHNNRFDNLRKITLRQNVRKFLNGRYASAGGKPAGLVRYGKNGKWQIRLQVDGVKYSSSPFDGYKDAMMALPAFKKSIGWK
jgi:hypothetical protein